MSLIFLTIFLSLISGNIEPFEHGIEFCMAWALFSIADAQWVSMLFKK